MVSCSKAGSVGKSTIQRFVGILFLDATWCNISGVISAIKKVIFWESDKYLYHIVTSVIDHHFAAFLRRILPGFPTENPLWWFTEVGKVSHAMCNLYPEDPAARRWKNTWFLPTKSRRVWAFLEEKPWNISGVSNFDSAISDGFCMVS